MTPAERARRTERERLRRRRLGGRAGMRPGVPDPDDYADPNSDARTGP